MKRIFTLGILFLLSVTATTSLAWAKAPLKSATVAAAGLEEPEFSSADDSNEIWYYIRFGRRANDNLVWTTDYPTNNNSWAVKQLTTMTTGDKTTQYWKLVGDKDQFYIVNRATGFKIKYADVVDAEKGIRGGNYIIDPEGGSTTLRMASSQENKEWTWSGALDWVIINPAISTHAFINDRAQNTDFPWRDVCNYGNADDGFRIQFVYAEKQTIAVPVDSLVLEAPLNSTGKSIFSGISGFNMSTTPITASIEGDDASHFGFLNGENTANGGSLTVTFAPQELRKYNATLVLSGGTAAPVRVRLIGDAFNVSALPKISSDDTSDEHWYYIQFFRKAAANTVWSLTDTTAMIIQDTLKATNLRDDQQWKICGTWEDGYYFINKATKEEITYNLTASDDGSRPASRYVRVGGLGDLFGFVRFGDTEFWQLYNWSTTASAKYINDSGGRHITNYNKNDAGNRLTFIPADEPVITTPVTSLDFSAPKGETDTLSLAVSGMLITSDITATISGSDASVFGFAENQATLPASGGTLKIVFSPVAVKSHTATLTLTSGTAVLNISLTGNSDLGLPIASEDGVSVWYQIQFSRKSTMAWTAVAGTDGRYNTSVMQKAKVDDNTEQQWKFVGSWQEGYRIINKNGGALSFDSVTTARILLIEDEAAGDLFLFKRANTTAKWELDVVGKYDDDDETCTRLNDYGGVNGDGSIGLYYAGDGGNTLNFFYVETTTGINTPAADINGKVVAVKYYNLVGEEVARPTASGIYIVRNTYASGQVKASKQMFIFK